jgi:hypothetical protein
MHTSPSPPSLPAKRVFCLVACAALVALAGCGSDRPPYSCVPVSGKVTYDDGSLIPADEIHLHFRSQTPAVDPKTPPREGNAVTNGKGEFEYATTFAIKDGIITGEHKVVVQCISKGRQLRGLIADEYNDPTRTPLTVDTSKLPFELKVHKPQH